MQQLLGGSAAVDGVQRASQHVSLGAPPMLGRGRARGRAGLVFVTGAVAVQGQRKTGVRRLSDGVVSGLTTLGCPDPLRLLGPPRPNHLEEGGGMNADWSCAAEFAAEPSSAGAARSWVGKLSTMAWRRWSRTCSWSSSPPPTPCCTPGHRFW